MASAQQPLLAECRFRPMTEADVPQVMDIEFDAYPFPWSEQIFRDCLRVGYHCVVVDGPQGLCGYGVMSTGAGEAHVLNVCVGRALRGRGAGRALMHAMLDHARNAGVELVFLEVRPSNRVAIALYESMGFERIGLRPGYYQASWGREDAFVYRLALVPQPLA